MSCRPESASPLVYSRRQVRWAISHYIGLLANLAGRIPELTTYVFVLCRFIYATHPCPPENLSTVSINTIKSGFLWSVIVHSFSHALHCPFAANPFSMGGRIMPAHDQIQILWICVDHGSKHKQVSLNDGFSPHSSHLVGY